jgi:hypothetical protein
LAKFGSLSGETISGLVGVGVGGLIAVAGQILNRESYQRHQLRMAALDHRLRSHQEAYALWRKLLSHVHEPDKIGGTAVECQDWWENSCLYLSPLARQAFQKAYVCAFNHHKYLSAHAEAKLVKANWADVMNAGCIIVEGAALPAIGDEANVLQDSPAN